MAKELRIILNGIFVLTPGPRDVDGDPDVVTILMPAADEPAGQIRAQHPYVVDRSGITLLRRQRLELVESASNAVHYVRRADWDGELSAATFGDIRWLADLRDVIGEAGAIDESCMPAEGKVISDRVAAVLVLKGGTFSTDFRWRSGQKQKFTGTDLPARYYASEVHIDLEFDDAIESVTLKTTPLDPGGAMAQDFVIALDAEKRTEVYVGNDTIEEIEVLGTDRPCPPRENDHVDNDFALYYNLIAGEVDQRPLPAATAGEGAVRGCAPITSDRDDPPVPRFAPGEGTENCIGSTSGRPRPWGPGGETAVQGCMGSTSGRPRPLEPPGETRHNGCLPVCSFPRR
jgi:hypothetical protein